MSVERSVVVRVRGSESTLELHKDIDSTRRRARKALPGDRADVVRFESLCSRLERKGVDELRAGAEHVEAPAASRLGLSTLGEGDLDQLAPELASTVRGWLGAGDMAIELRDPFGVGPTRWEEEDSVEAPIAEPWRAPGGEQGRRAVARRFEEQLEKVAGGVPGAAISPSGVSNSVLTEGLHLSVEAGGGERVDAPVSYRDGSSAREFPLRVLPFTGEAPSSPRVLRFSLLSIRHTEMDVEVDGAWLRNTDISRLRPAAETDELVFALSLEQLATLTREEPVTIFMYQTGLETAIVGFYRALTEHLLEHPKSVAVVPMYFRRGQGGSRSVGGSAQESTFSPGKPWAT
jgi:hypothetical protein